MIGTGCVDQFRTHTVNNVNVDSIDDRRRPILQEEGHIELSDRWGWNNGIFLDEESDVRGSEAK